MSLLPGAVSRLGPNLPSVARAVCLHAAVRSLPTALTRSDSMPSDSMPSDSFTSYRGHVITASYPPGRVGRVGTYLPTM